MTVFHPVTICNVCRSSGFSELAVRSDGEKVIRCDTCGMGVVQRIPEDTSIFYSGDYFGVGAQEEHGYHDYEMTAAHGLLWVRLLVEKLRSGGRILDVGCANGHLLNHLPEGFEKFGIEANEPMAQQAAQSGITMLGGDVLSDHLRRDYASSFDIITSIATFEHVADFRGAVETCLDLLKPDGILIFEVPLISSSHDNSTWFSSSLEHIYYPTVEGIERLFRKELGVVLIGEEAHIHGFASNYVGVVCKSATITARCEAAFAAMTSASPTALQGDDRILNLAYMVGHKFAMTPDRALHAHELMTKVQDPNLTKRLGQLWYQQAYSLDDHVYRLKVATDSAQWAETQATNWKQAFDNLSASVADHGREVEALQAGSAWHEQQAKNWNDAFTGLKGVFDAQSQALADCQQLAATKTSEDPSHLQRIEDLEARLREAETALEKRTTWASPLNWPANVVQLLTSRARKADS